jgi:hypothetical protein
MHDMVRTQIRIEYFYDDETGRWDYVVPQLHIVGGGGATKADAARRAAEAIAFALGDGLRKDVIEDPDVEYLSVSVG